jgi:HNH endonuclease
MDEKWEGPSKRGEAGYIYVTQKLSDLGFGIEKSTFHRLKVQQGDSEPINVAIKNWKVSKDDSSISKLDDLYSADAYIFVRSDDPEDLRGYIYLADEIDKAQHSSLTAKDFPFSVDLGTENPAGAGYWARKGWIFCDPDRLNAWHLMRKAAPSAAIDDISQVEVGNSDPEYRERMSGSYVRDQEVRRRVVNRANGICEYAGCTTFQKANGQAYLEAHHVISLSAQGPDNLSNVIALCPNHHREAHFGERWQLLQDEFTQILQKLAS